ncbi:tyrosine-type recombinase/integrase [Seohaeicola saemankumensis]|uniref:Tyrosine-type recombinase/integrase n=1 Tax=Seohaeicola saemankumensis TaxID=481181 RepID=A0ABW3TEB1_9RHOB
MAKLFNASIKAAADGKLQDGRGLILVKTGETGRWVFRYSHLGRRREMGLGSWPVVTLGDARKQRDKWATILASGEDPIDVRDAENQAKKEKFERDDPTFAELVDLVFEAKKASLRGDGTRGRWRSPLALHMIPVFGSKAGSKITQRHLVEALRPIWKTKNPTAQKAIRRTGIVLRSAKLMGFPVDPDITRSAREILGVVHHNTQHVRSVPWQEVPELYSSLPSSLGGECNRWIILTLVRLEAARCALVSEVDFENRIWTVPAERIKGQLGKTQDFRVPLTQPLIDLALARKEMGVDQIFPNINFTGSVSNTAIGKALATVQAPGSAHGFRTSFRTWVQETDACSYDVAEMVLGHRVGGIVERSYARSDLLDKRRKVMEAWTRFVTKGPELISNPEH